MPAKPLNTEQKADALRLKAAFERHQKRLADAGKPHSQEEIAEHLPFKQSAMSQYLNGKIPLNAEALLAFCGLMGEEPAAISPSIHAREFDWSLKWISPSRANSTSHEGEVQMPVKGLSTEVISALEKAAPEDLEAIDASLRLMLNLGKGPSGKRRQA